MKTLHESILGSVNAGKEYYKNLVISELDRCLSKIRSGYNIYAEQFPGHSKPTIVIAGLAFASTRIELDEVSQKVLDSLKFFDGIVEELNGVYYIPETLVFSNLNHINIDLSSFDYTDSRYQHQNHLGYDGIELYKCTNTNIVQLPKYDANYRHLVVINQSTISSICKLSKTATLQIKCGNSYTYKIDLSPFYNLTIKSFRLDSDYFRNNHTPDYNKNSIYNTKCIIGDVLQGYDESIRHILDMNIAENVYIDFYGLHKNSTYLIKTTDKGDFSVIKKRTTREFML